VTDPYIQNTQAQANGREKEEPVAVMQAVREKKQRDRERVGIEKCDGRSHRCKLFRITFQNAFLKYFFNKKNFKIIFYIFSCVTLKINF
jgi:hypothetical protein